MSCSHQGLLVTRSAWGRATLPNITPFGTKGSLMNRPLPVLIGWWEGAFCLWPSVYRVLHLWASPWVMLMEGHLFSKGCKTHGAGSLIPCLFVRKAGTARYYTCVVSNSSWGPGLLQTGCPRLLKQKHLTHLVFVRISGGPPKSPEVTSAYSFPDFLLRKCVVPNSMILRRKPLWKSLDSCTALC